MEPTRDPEMDGVFRALADASRRRLLDSLNARNGQTLRELCAGLAMTRQSVSKHLAVLEAAGLVTTMWRGREKLHHLNAAPVTAIADRWISRYGRERASALAALSDALEREPMSETEFSYTTYIRTTPERLWQALTDPAFTRRYWGLSLKSDWTAGSTVTWDMETATMADDAQVVLEADPPRRLSYTWHTFTPEFARAVGFSDEMLAKASAERRSKVTYDIAVAEPGVVRLTVLHDDFDPGSVVLDSVSHGWPSLLSSLKTMLETGEPLPS